MKLSQYEVRVLHRLPAAVRNAVQTAVNAHVHRKRHPKQFKALYFAAVRALSLDFGNPLFIRIGDAQKEMVALRLTPDFPDDIDERLSEMPAKVRAKIAKNWDALDLASHTLGVATAVLKRMEPEYHEVMRSELAKLEGA